MIDRSKLRVMTKDMKDALAGFEKKYGVVVKIGNVSFCASNFTTKVSVAEIGCNGVAETREVTDFRLAAHLYDLKATDLGRSFKSGSRMFTVAGINLRAHKLPILATSGGKTFKFAAETVKARLG